MKVIRFDSVGGASGNMILGALLDLGVDAGALRRVLETLSFGAFELTAETVVHAGLRGIRLRVDAEDLPSGPPGHPAHGHPGRHLSDVEAILDRGALSERVRSQASAVFRRLAEAEARVHGTTPENVHFHEVGALDSIVDIVGCCWALEALGVDAVAVPFLPLGQGTHTCAHGVMPLPVPATVELLKGRIPTVSTTETCELVTPTGAALLTTWPRAENSDGLLLKSGCGFGTRELAGRPNLLRATLVDTGTGGSSLHRERCTVLECSLDDMSPELVGALVDRLMEEGVLDAYTCPLMMKKQRPGVLLTVLCRTEDQHRMADILFTESTTFGLRVRESDRLVLARDLRQVDTPYGPIQVKAGFWLGSCITVTPELEDCRRVARQHGVPLRRVLTAAQAKAETMLGNPEVEA